ncbi:hypothetical protein [Herbiconiux sp. A18JL235]|uniref:Cell division protein FtsK n=1 Tax=Herbiconiux sp. A18JL235 TaxID=3152363 RepID=A0AB39BKZ9_9MICO
MSGGEMVPTQPQTALAPTSTESPRRRRLVVVTAISAAAYAVFSQASMGRCPGGGSDATGLGEGCISVTLSPSPLVFLAMASILLVALARIARRASDASVAERLGDRAAAAIGLLAVVSLAVCYLWWATDPTAGWSPGEPFSTLLPFPFASVDIEITR